MERIQLRKKARQTLISFTRYTKPDYEVAAVHRRIAAKLDEVVEGRCRRLMIFTPPRVGKSELSSRKLPAYFLGRYPKRSVIAAAYGDDLATDFGRDVRNLIADKPYHALFPEVTLAPDSQAKGHWHTNHGGSYLSASIGMGAGTGVTGRGAHLLIIDDPVKSRANAESDTYREGIKAWYRAVAYTRLEKDAAIVLIQTRWHEDDLGGWLLEQEATDGDKWEKLILPAIDEEGQSIWPDKFSVEVLKQTRAVVGEYDWASLYEQIPRPVGGSYFEEKDLLVDGQAVEYPSLCDGVFAVIDSAAKTGKENDATAVTFYARAQYATPPLLILDWDVAQIEGAMLEMWLPWVFAELERFAKEVNARHGSIGVWIEDKSTGMVLLQQATLKGLDVKPIDSKLTALGKIERGINISGYVRRGDVKISKPAYDRVKTYKGRTRNHLLAQILNFRIGSKDMIDDDLFDTFCYGVALGVGSAEGF